MGFLDEFKKLTRPYDDDDDFYSEDEDIYEAPAPRKSERRPNPFAEFGASERIQNAFSSQRAPANQPVSAPAAAPASAPKRDGKVVNLGASQMNVVVESPQEFEEAAVIADHLRSGRSIVVNMETTPKDVVRRLVDFLSGVAYALDGTIQKVSANTYFIAPYNVSLTGNTNGGIENSNLYF